MRSLSNAILGLLFFATAGPASAQFSPPALTSTSADQQSTLGFNWGSDDGVKAAMESAKKDGAKEKKGYLLQGERFWNSLMDAQSDSDHQAGDGLYFSTDPFNSIRFGPNLMLLEMTYSTGQDESVVDVLTKEVTAAAHSKDLAPIIRYSGAWHVIKSLPPLHKMKIWLRKPTANDATLIFEKMGYRHSTALSLAAINQLVFRQLNIEVYSGRSKKMAQKYRVNKSTEQYLNTFLHQILQEGLSFTPTEMNDQKKLSEMGHHLFQILQTLSRLKNFLNWNTNDFKEHLYQRILQIENVPPSFVETLRRFDAKMTDSNSALSAKKRAGTFPPLICQKLFSR